MQESLSVEPELTFAAEQSTREAVVRAGASVTEYFPVMVATIGKRQAQAILLAGRLQSPSVGMQSWKVTAMNGQRVGLGDRTQTAFVVGIRKNREGWEEPLIKILEEGTRLTFRAVHSDDRRQIDLKGRVEINKLGDVHEVRTVCNGMPAIVQAPTGKRWRIDFDSTVEEGGSVLIGFVPTYEQKLVVYALLTAKRSFRKPRLRQIDQHVRGGGRQLRSPRPSFSPKSARRGRRFWSKIACGEPQYGLYQTHLVDPGTGQG